MDLSKLTPAPWTVGQFSSLRGGESPINADGFPLAAAYHYRSEDETKANAQFIALARNAFDVMMRRGWGVRKFKNDKAGGEQWSADNVYGDGFWFPHHDKNLKRQFWPDPFTALVEADKWYREHVEATPASPSTSSAPVPQSS